MNFKKLMLAIAAVALISTAMVACGKKNNKNNNNCFPDQWGRMQCNNGQLGGFGNGQQSCYFDPVYGQLCNGFGNQSIPEDVCWEYTDPRTFQTYIWDGRGACEACVFVPPENKYKCSDNL